MQLFCLWRSDEFCFRQSDNACRIESDNKVYLLDRECVGQEGDFSASVSSLYNALLVSAIGLQW